LALAIFLSASALPVAVVPAAPLWPVDMVVSVVVTGVAGAVVVWA
jgi:hypothetical protein